MVDDEAIVSPGELGLSEDAFSHLGIEPGGEVSIGHAEPPHSMDAVRRKIGGERIGLDAFRAIARDITHGRYSKMEIAAFLVAACI